MRIHLPLVFTLLLAISLPLFSPAGAAENAQGFESLETEHFILLSEKKPDAQLGRVVEQVWKEVAKTIEDMDVAFKEVVGENKISIALYSKPGSFAGYIDAFAKQANVPSQQVANMKKLVGTMVPGGLIFNAENRTADTIQGPIVHLLAGYLLRLRLHHLQVKTTPEWLPIAFSYTIEFELMKKPSIRYVGYAEDSMGEQEYKQTEIFTDENWASTLRDRVRKGTTMNIYTVGVLTTAELTAESVAFLYSLGRFLTSTPANRKQFNAFLRLMGEKPEERSAVLLLEAFEMDNAEFEKRWMNFIKSRSFK